MAKTLTVFLAADVSKLNRGLKDASGQMQGFGSTLKSVVGPALIAAGAAAGAFAIKLGVDGVKAAAEDQAAMEKLAQTLENLNLAHDTTAVENYITELERSLGIADTELRPAYDRLIRSIGDTAKANEALALALDVSVGTGKSLDAVVQALGRAYDGNTQGLSRLGAGLDNAILKTKDMDRITAALSQTFGGQATTNAQTFEGQARRVTTAIDNMKEAFGAGLLGALGDTNDSTQNLVDTMAQMEPILRGAGGAVGRFAEQSLRSLSEESFLASTNVEDAAAAQTGMTKSAELGAGAVEGLTIAFFGVNSPLGTFFRLLGLANDEQTDLNRTNLLAAQRYEAMALAIDKATIAQSRYANVTFNASSATSSANVSTLTAVKQAERLGITVAELNRRLAAQAAQADNVARATRGAAAGTNDLTAAQQAALAAYDAQRGRVQTAIDGLGNAVTALNNARQAFRDYAASIENAVLSVFNFGEALKPATNEAGQVSGASFVAGLVQQVTDARNFATVLTNLRNAGADQALIDQVVALGPAAGAALGQALITEGLVPTVNALTIEAQTIAKDVGFTMASEFLGAGVEAAVNFVNQAILTVGAEQRRLIKLGNNMGKLIGSGIKKEIAQAVAEAVREAEAAKAAARAEAVAAAEARAQAVTDQQVAQALSRLVINSDQRLGRNPSPVL